MAFDIAEKVDIGDEEGWIIPTSGHRAYPHSVWLLENLRNHVFGEIREIVIPYEDDEYWKELPDHYQIAKAPPPAKLNVRSLLAGLRPTLSFKRRI